MRRAALALLLSCGLSSLALAGEVPLTQPAPAWVTKAPLDSAAATSPDAPELLVLDTQARIENGLLWTYTDRAVRVSSAEALNQLATLTLPWAPDKGDLIIHEVSILRDGKVIDLLAGGKNFTVLRREESLEQLEYTGILTATLPAEGLRTGDTLRLRYSVTLRDGALEGRVQTAFGVPAAPLRIGFARTRLQWDSKTAAHWQAKGDGLGITPTRNGAFTQIEVTTLLPKQPERPQDAPARFTLPPMIEASSFADWADVSRVMAPLYATDGLITPGSPLAAELDKVKAAPTPLERAQRALRLVQDEVRYFAVGMDGGNYLPQKPADTWTKRYGDCKAKTLLLLALLHGAGIEAEPVLANSQAGDTVPVRLPAAAAFDHVLVHARIDGQDLWLDGTGSGSRIEDIHDTPDFEHVLPLRTKGAGLIDLPLRPAGRPLIALSVDADESSSVDLPSAFTAKAVLRGGFYATLSTASAKMDAKQRNEMIDQVFTKLLNEGRYTDETMSVDPATASVTLSARGLKTTAWRWDDKRMRRALSRMPDTLTFEPNRARTDWAQIPVAIPGPSSARLELTVHLPGHGQGFTVEGKADADATAAGRHITLHMTNADGVVHLQEQVEALGGEIAAADIPAQRDKVEAIMATRPRLIAPADTPRSWDLPAGAAKSGQLAAIESIYESMIREVEPGDASPWLGRASLRRGIGDYAGAVADFTSALAIAPDAETYLQRASALYGLGRIKDALADAQKARGLDPAMTGAVGMSATLMAENGDLAGATALLDQKIALGGKPRDIYREAKAALIGRYGDPAEALKLIDTLIEDKPGSPALLNARCWIKGTRAVMLEGALKDCTSAIELSGNAFAPLDSRAMVWLRMGRYAEALADLDAVLQAVPGKAESRFLRAIVRSQMPQQGAATHDLVAQDLAIARRIDPGVDHDYALFGIVAGKPLAAAPLATAPTAAKGG
jgi:tetratricopeptide (TPR) repeat protein/transglutaminase-like putative cysteine protease